MDSDYPCSCFNSTSMPKHINIVALETFYTAVPKLNIPPPHTFTLTEYVRTSSAEISSRIHDADIVIVTTIPITAELLSESVCPRLRLITVVASGTDSIDLLACAARKIRVLSSPNCNSDAVAEHAIALYFVARRAVVPTMRELQAGQWKEKGTLMTSVYVAGAGSPPRSCHQEIAVIVGYGGVGRKASKMLRALGMEVVIAGRKSASSSVGNKYDQSENNDERVPFERALQMATVLVLCCPRAPETFGLISAHELSLMRPDCILINVSRGGIVDEKALLVALKKGQIAGAGVDVFAREPATAATTPLLSDDAQVLNLVVTPHSAWVAADTTANYQRVLQENISGFILGEVQEERVRV